MALRERLTREFSANGVSPVRNQNGAGAADGVNGFHEMKARLQRALIDRMDLTKLKLLTPKQTNTETVILATEETPLSMAEREQLIEEVRHELFGLGPLELLLADPTISDILVNSPHKIFIERGGRLERANVSFNDNEHVIRVIERIVSSIRRRIA